MPLPNLILKDFWLKLFSLALAVLIWLTVSFAIQKEGVREMSPSGIVNRLDFADLPVLVVSAAGDVRDFKVNPGRVTVTVSGRPEILRKLQGTELRVLVDLTDFESAHESRKRVDVSTPPGVTLENVSPGSVEIIAPPKPPVSAPRKTS